MKKVGDSNNNRRPKNDREGKDSWKKKSGDKPFANKRSFDKKEGGFDKPRYNRTEKEVEKKKVLYLDENSLENSTRIGQPAFKSSDSNKKSTIRVFDNTETRLNKFIANAGVCSRREADELITMGLITVNGEEVTDFSFRVKPSDRVKYNDQLLNAEERVYILLNKPKGFITTTSDPEDRKTVIDIVQAATPFRVYPVGRLDRNTTGVLLMTNDGDFMEKITHPRFNIHKVYKVTLEEKATLADLEQLLEGVHLEDGLAKADAIAFLDDSKTVIGVEIHSGKNRIVRRMFEHLKHEVKRLDRTAFGPFTKTKLKPGEFRFLNDKELQLVERLKGQKTKSEPQKAEKTTKSYKPFNERKSYQGDKPPGDKREFGDKKPYGAKKPFGDKKSFDDKKPYGDKREFGDKKPYGAKKPFGDKKSVDDKKSYGDKKEHGDKKSFDDKREPRKNRYPAPTRNAKPTTKKSSAPPKGKGSDRKKR